MLPPARQEQIQPKRPTPEQEQARIHQNSQEYDKSNLYFVPPTITSKISPKQATTQTNLEYNERGRERRKMGHKATVQLRKRYSTLTNKQCHRSCTSYTS